MRSAPEPRQWPAGFSRRRAKKQFALFLRMADAHKRQKQHSLIWKIKHPCRYHIGKGVLHFTPEFTHTPNHEQICVHGASMAENVWKMLESKSP